MSARKRTISGPPTPKCRLLTQPNIKRTTNENLNPNITLAESVAADPLQSQKYMQHKLDMAYNKYIQNLALENMLTKMHKEAERSIDEQLVVYQEKYESSVEELQSKKTALEEITTTINNVLKLKFLESSLEEVYKLMDENTLEKLKRKNENLQMICDNLNFENITFISTEENYIKLQNILSEMYTLLEEVNGGSSEDFNLFVDNICKAQDLIAKLRQTEERAKNYQNKLNKLVLETASMELSKTGENNQSLTS